MMWSDVMGRREGRLSVDTELDSNQQEYIRCSSNPVSPLRNVHL